MDPATIALLVKLADLALWGLQRLPARNSETESRLQKIVEMINNGETPSREDFEDVLARIKEQSQIRDNIIAMKSE